MSERRSTSVPCWFCDVDLRTDPPPTGWLYDDGVWRAGHAPAGYAIAGTVVLEAYRHVLDQAAMSAQEAASLVGVTGRLVTAIRQATGCDRVYQWATMDAFPHFHLWLVPWSSSGALRGPRHLVASVGTAAATAEPDVVRETAEAIRAALC
jgi:hypothetical protein